MKFKEFLLQEGLYDPGIFKAFFMAGGPGSGKTFIASNTFTGTGLKFVNSDSAFERGLKQAGLSDKMPDQEKYFRDIIRGGAKRLTNKRLDMYVSGRLGLVIDATGRDYGRINSEYNMLKALGYDCHMIFVNTTLSVALERNLIRSRQIPEYVVKSSWEKVQTNIGKFQRLFGLPNFLVVDNNRSDKELVTQTLAQCDRLVRRTMREPIKSHIAKSWISKEQMYRKKLNESVIDTPRTTYAPGVFDDYETKSPKLKPSVREIVDNQLKEFGKEYPIIKVALVGSILTKRYRANADLDFNVLFDVPVDKQEEERLRLSHKYLSAKSPEKINGKLIPGTQHPINYYIITNAIMHQDQEDKADSVFDYRGNMFVKRPQDYTFDMNLYLSAYQRKVQGIDVVKGELKRDIIDYDELKDLQPNDILNLQDKINDKLEEIERDIKDVVDIGDDVLTGRRLAFDNDMSPEQIKTFSIKNRLPKNVVYKMLEKYHYLKFYKKCKEILDDGKVTDAEIDSLKSEAVASKSIAITFGRFNPPTIGHEKLINKVARADRNYKIYISRSEDSKKNPLSAREKLSWMKKMFPQYARNIEINTTNMILDIASMLYNKGYNILKFVVGSDRVREFDTILKKYNDQKNRHGYYNFKNIDVISAGERDPDAEGASGMSASKMRDAASKGDVASFKRGVPSQFRDVNGLFKAVRKGMGIREDYKPDNSKPLMGLGQFEQKQVRDLYVREMIFNIGDQVKYLKEDKQGKVVRRGTNYVVLEDTNNNLHKCWIWDCIPVAADKEPMLREYNLDIDYGFEAVESIPVPKPYSQFKDSYEIGADYANHCKQMTPGEREEEPPVDSKDRGKPTDKYISRPGKATDAKIGEDKLTEKEVKEWSNQDTVIDKYKERYKEEWKAKLNEVVAKMIEKL
jgi:predicted kinase|tara:strand:- start:1707 stop:4439 length:2733 start_codon:yes stop_codon:yes gene_type:complete